MVRYSPGEADGTNVATEVVLSAKVDRSGLQLVQRKLSAPRRQGPGARRVDRRVLRRERDARAATGQPSFRPAASRLAARHGRTLRPDEPLAEARLGPLLAAAGWTLTRYDDPPDHFLATATRAVTR